MTTGEKPRRRSRWASVMPTMPPPEMTMFMAGTIPPGPGARPGPGSARTGDRDRGRRHALPGAGAPPAEPEPVQHHRRRQRAGRRRARAALVEQAEVDGGGVERPGEGAAGGRAERIL